MEAGPLAERYFEQRGIAPEIVDTFGLGFCNKGSMAGRVCIPIHNAPGPARGSGVRRYLFLLLVL